MIGEVVGGGKPGQRTADDGHELRAEHVSVWGDLRRWPNEPVCHRCEDDARQQAADLNVTFNQYGQRDQADRREVSPPIEVSQPPGPQQAISTTWVKQRQEWWGGVRRPRTSGVDQSC